MTVTTALPDGLDGDPGDLQDPYPAEPLGTTLDRIVEFNRTYVHHKDDSTHDLVALWIASTHAMPVWDWHGRVYITAPQPGCGKSTQGKVMAMLCPNSLPSGSISGPGLFRSISAEQNTVFIDEAENTFSAHSGRDGDILTSVVNDGYEQGKTVTRSEGNVAVHHSIYAAVAIIGVDNGRLAPTTKSRCIPVLMTPGGQAPAFRKRRHQEFADEIQARLATQAHEWELHELDRETFPGRQSDCWEALYSVAVEAGPKWVERFTRAAKHHVWPEDVSESALVLAGVRDYFKVVDKERVGSTDLVAYLNGRDDLPTITSNKALCQTWLKGYRTPTGQHIKTTKSNGNYVYLRSDFADAFTTWL